MHKKINLIEFLKLMIRILGYGILIFLSFFNKIKRKKTKLDNSKKIMILVGKISKGGAERAAVNIAKALSKKYEVIIVTYYDNKKLKDVEEYECMTKHIVIQRKGFRKILEIRKLKKKNKITHCISLETNSNFINSITRVYDKVIIYIVNYLSVSEKDIENKRKNIISNKLSDYIVSVSKQVEIDQIKNYNVKSNKISTIPTYCNRKDVLEYIEKYEIDEQDKNIFINNKVIITIGKLKEQKGQWHLIRAFKNVVKQNPNVKLIILGIGELEDYLKKLIKDLNLENYVYCLGHKNKNVYSYLKKSDIFVLPSLFEGMPNVILEAMECGLPIISTDCYGGNREIIEPSLEAQEEIYEKRNCEYGILIPKLDFNLYNSEQSLTKEEIILSEAINELLNDEKLLNYYKKMSLKRIMDFDKDDYAEEWEVFL